MIKTLIEQGHAYAVENGDVYFSVRSDETMVKCLAAISTTSWWARALRKMKSSATRSTSPCGRPLNRVNPAGKAPRGRRPSRLAHRVRRHGASLLGVPIDIHGGGSDLAFPHHENECAQATCAWHRLSNTWMHTGMLLVDGEKMSKSLGNFFTLEEVLEKHSAAALRLLMLQTHYRSPLDFASSAWKARKARWPYCGHGSEPALGCGPRDGASPMPHWLKNSPTLLRLPMPSSRPAWMTTSTPQVPWAHSSASSPKRTRTSMPPTVRLMPRW